jgi:hypothetical protein
MMNIEEIDRHTTPEFINEVLNHPSIRPWVANGSEPIDVSDKVADKRNVLLMGPHGGSMAVFIQPGVYEVHTQILPDGRGRWAMEFLATALDWMMTRTPCYELLTRVPHGHKGAKMAAVLGGFKYEFTREKECRFMDRLVDVDIYSIRIQDWVMRSRILEDIGREFHDTLHNAAERFGVKDQPHADDPNHNRYVGAAYEMIRHGYVKKGVLFYNRWAAVSRHPLITLRQLETPMQPSIIDIDHGLSLVIKGDQYEVSHVATH